MKKKWQISLIAFATAFALALGAIILPSIAPITALATEATVEPAATQAADSGATEAPQAEATEVPAAVSIPSDPEAVVVTVNGQAIKAGEVKALYEYLLEYFAYYYGYDTTDTSIQASIYNYTIDASIEEALLLQRAETFGITTTDEDRVEAQANYDSQLAQYEESLLASIENPTDEDKANVHAQALEAAEAVGLTVDALVESALLTKVQEAVTATISVTDEDVDSYYNGLVEADKELYQNDFQNYEMMKQYAAYLGQAEPLYMPAGVRGVKHILLAVPEEMTTAYQNATAVLEEALDETEETEPETTGEAVTAAPEATEEPVKSLEEVKAEMIAYVQATVDEINTKLAAGTSFDDLVVEYGTDPGMQSEPYKTQGYALHLDSQMYDPAFKEGAFNQLEKVGDVSGPIAGSYGVHILYYAMDIPEGGEALTAEARESYRSKLTQNKLYELIDGWKTEATIEYATAQ